MDAQTSMTGPILAIQPKKGINRPVTPVYHLANIQQLPLASPDYIGTHIFEYQPLTKQFHYIGKRQPSTPQEIRVRLQDLLADYAAHILGQTIKAVSKFEQRRNQYIERLSGGQHSYIAIDDMQKMIQQLRHQRGKLDTIRDQHFFVALLEYLVIKNKIEFEINEDLPLDLGENVVELLELLGAEENMETELRGNWCLVIKAHTGLNFWEILALDKEQLAWGRTGEWGLAWWFLREKSDSQEVFAYYLNAEEGVAAMREEEVKYEDLMEDDNVSEGLFCSDASCCDTKSDYQDDLVDDDDEVELDEQTKQIILECDVAYLRNFAETFLGQAHSGELRYTYNCRKLVPFFHWAENIDRATKDELRQYITAQKDGVISVWIRVAINDELTLEQVLSSYASDPLVIEDAFRGFPPRLSIHGPVFSIVDHNETGEWTTHTIHREYRTSCENGFGIRRQLINTNLKENQRPKPPLTTPQTPQRQRRQRIRTVPEIQPLQIRGGLFR